MSDFDSNPYLAALLGAGIVSNNQAYYHQQTINQRQEDIIRSFCPSDEFLLQSISSMMLVDEIDAAEQFLNNKFAKEVVFIARNQRPSTLSLDQILDEVREKYNKYYSKIGRTMPVNLSSLNADTLCKLTNSKELKALSKSEEEQMRNAVQEKQRHSKRKLLLFLLICIALIIIITTIGILTA